jgi:arginyl-tRNA synthetase
MARVFLFKGDDMGKQARFFTGCMAVLLVSAGCHKKDENQLNKALSTVQLGAEQGVNAVKDMVADTKADYQKSTQDKLDQISASIDDLKKKAETADGQARAGLRQSVADLQKQRDDLQVKLDSLKNSTTDAWKDMTGGIDQSLRDLQKASDKAVSQFKAPAPGK